MFAFPLNPRTSKDARLVGALLLIFCLAIFLPSQASAATVSCSGVAAWSGNSVSYSVGTLVTYNGSEYKCLQAHTSQAGWDPVDVPALWSLQGTCSTSATPTPTPTAKATATPTATTKPTATPTATTKPTATPTATATPSGGTCWPAWNSTAVYTGGAQVSYNNENYQAAYWTQGNNPSTSSGPAGSGQPWIPEGSCSGSGGATPTPTATTKPTATPTATPTPTALAGCSGVGSISAGGKTYNPTWCQEFNGGAGSPDTSVWKFDLGNNGGWGNGEVEVYCGPPGYAGNPSQCPTSFSTSTSPVYIDGSGHLAIQPRNVGGTWISGRMNTEGITNFQYGVIEASIQLPDTTNQGLWPAFWSLGSDITTVPWPNCGEADIMENWSPQVLNGAGPGGNNSTIHTAVTGGSGIGARYSFPGGQAANTGFHRYGMIWQANEIQFYVDNPATPFFTVTPSNLPAGDTWPFNNPIFLLMNVAVGGTLGGSTSGLSNPAPMLVDYVRYYQ